MDFHAELPFLSWGIEGPDSSAGWNCTRTACFKIDGWVVNSRSGTYNVRVEEQGAWINSIPDRFLDIHPAGSDTCHEIAWPDYSPDPDLVKLARRVSDKTGAC
ncbi:hypothetical protein [Nocardioides antri]|uniref:Uncharacterized protein n=1 Tax=Nocardioides antri TaxID=2607659 RepID=A0A5B1LUH9_9ACTN|nr:hypothetical protein [Nocardioides antri]KAA1424323.1 hypothetical protein F0U47_19000 [Nocardioides antri]